MLGTYLCDRYTLNKLLSNRNARRIYLAWDSQRCTQVVIKILPFSYGFDWDNLKHFERETNLLEQLSHPAIPQYLDGFDIDLPDFKGFAWVQTYIAAKSLAEHIQQGRTFNESDLKEIAVALLEVLVFLHGRNPAIIHRDLKPSNILLGDRTGHSCGEVHLIDFETIQLGMSFAEGTVTVAGTYGYGAPEQFKGEAVPVSDIYGLGMTLIHLVTGTNPATLPVRNGLTIFESPQLSNQFSDWIRGTIHAETHRRFRSASTALKALTQKDFELSKLSPNLQRPIDSKLEFYKNSQVISCTIPPVGSSWQRAERLSSIGQSIFTFLVFLFLISGAAILIAPLLLPLWIWLLWMLGRSMLKPSKDMLLDIFGRTHIKATYNQFSTTTEFVCLRNKQVIDDPVSKIERLSNWVTTPAASYPAVLLLIHGGNRTIKITASAAKTNVTQEQNLTIPELDWLASELSEWFGVPIEKDNTSSAQRWSQQDSIEIEQSFLRYSEKFCSQHLPSIFTHWDASELQSLKDDYAVLRESRHNSLDFNLLKESAELFGKTIDSLELYRSKLGHIRFEKERPCMDLLQKDISPFTLREDVYVAKLVYEIAFEKEVRSASIFKSTRVEVVLICSVHRIRLLCLSLNEAVL